MPTIEIGKVFAAPATQVRIPVILDTTDGGILTGLQFNVDIDPDHLALVAVEDINTATTLSLGYSETGAAPYGTPGVSTIFTGYNLDNAPVANGTFTLFTLVCDVKAIDPGDTVDVLLMNSLMIAPDESIVDHAWIHGAVIVGVRGDMDLDGNVTILDVVRLIGFLHGRIPFTGPVEIPDVTGDGAVNIADVIRQVKTILG